MSYCCINIFIHTLCFFFIHYYHLIKKNRFLDLIKTNSSILTPVVSSVILPTTNLFELSWYFDLAEWLLKSLLSSTKNEYIFGFNQTGSSILTPVVSSAT